MPTLNEKIADQIVRHQVYIQRFGGGTMQAIMALLNRADSDVSDQITRRAARIAEKGFDSGPETTKRLNSMIAEIRQINRGAYQAAGKELTDRLRDFSEYESNWQTGLLVDGLPSGVRVRRPPMQLVRAAAMARPFQGRLLSEWLDGMESAKSARVRDAVRLGLVEGQTIDQIVRRIRGSRVAGYADGLMEIDRRAAATMVRTAVNHTASVARDEVWAANDDIIKELAWHATLDGRTCPTCGALDGKTFPIGKGPRTPRHHGCRCTMVPVLKSWREMGIDVDEIEPSTRASMNGQVPASLNYGEWLAKQSVSVQNDVLGPTRADMFRTGKVTLDSFVDGGGRPISLAELRQIEPTVFRQPGASGRFVDQFEAVIPDVSTPLRAALVKFENAVRDQRLEHAAVFNPAGTLLGTETGLPNQVSFPKIKVSPQGATFTHNHPGDAGFSFEDVLNAINLGLAELRVVGPEMRYSLAPGRKGWPSPLALQKEFDEARAMANASVMEMLRANEIGAADLEGHAVDIIWRQVAGKLGLRYNRERS